MRLKDSEKTNRGISHQLEEVLLGVGADLCGRAGANEGGNGLDVFWADSLQRIEKALVLLLCPVTAISLPLSNAASCKVKN